MRTTSITLLAVALTMAGCASQPETTGGEFCTLPTMRNVGMGVTVESCSAWTFGPSRVQRERFNLAHGLSKDAK